MAEIRIERKRRGLGWLWLLLALLIVVALAWYFLASGRTTTPPATGAPPTTGSLEQRNVGGYDLASRALADAFVAPAS